MRPVKYEVYESGSSDKLNHHVSSPLIGIPFDGSISAGIPLENTVTNCKTYLRTNTQRIPTRLSSLCPHIFLSEAERAFWVGVFDTETLLARARHGYEFSENEAKNAHRFLSSHSSTVKYSNLDDLEAELKQLLELSGAMGLRKGSNPSIISDTLEVLSVSELTNVEEFFTIFQDSLKGKGGGFTKELISRHYPVSILLDKLEEMINSLEIQMNLFCTTAALLSNIFDDIDKLHMTF
ncbi:unnamed protein product [Phytomonas sp. EM1]|nr:unnamed protein product [Phytomonas sp. EM1]|eukprot:CCW62665.1 unnamed protein product [Phytomonas sp. isolate EM1]